MVEMDSASQINNTNKAPAPAPTEKAVAHEFVRQYYTIMNKSPELLHRFYCQDSSLIKAEHEDRDPPTRNGLEAIMKHFSNLKPQEIVAKIRALDCMVTDSNNIVIQVSGTLVICASSGKETTRSFVQTFILVGQATNKYYVRNDIFRYQDAGTVQNGILSPQPEVVERAVEEQEMVEPEPEPEPEPEYEPEPEPVADVRDESAEVPSEEPMEPESASEPEKVVENGHDATVQEAEEKPVTETKEPVNNGPISYARVTRNWAGVVSVTASNNTTSAPTTTVEPAPQKPAEPAAAFVDASAGDSLKSNTFTSPESNASDQPGRKFSKKLNTGSAQVTNGASFPASTQQNSNGINNNGRKSFENKAENGNFEELANGECQLFVGNLTPTTTEEILEEVFGKYGKIIAIRLNRANPNKPGVKNYGFISFESPAVVDQIVAKKPIFHEGHRFNVERKDPAVRPYPRKNENRPYDNSRRGDDRRPPTMHAGGPPRTNGNGNMPSNGNNGFRQDRQGGPGSVHRPRNMHYQGSNSGGAPGGNPNMNRNFTGGKNRV